jgi:hypothetical protein
MPKTETKSPTPVEQIQTIVNYMLSEEWNFSLSSSVMECTSLTIFLFDGALTLRGDGTFTYKDTYKEN